MVTHLCWHFALKRERVAAVHSIVGCSIPTSEAGKQFHLLLRMTRGAKSKMTENERRIDSKAGVGCQVLSGRAD